MDPAEPRNKRHLLVQGKPPPLDNLVNAGNLSVKDLIFNIKAGVQTMNSNTHVSLKRFDRWYSVLFEKG